MVSKQMGKEVHMRASRQQLIPEFGQRGKDSFQGKASGRTSKQTHLHCSCSGQAAVWNRDRFNV